MDEEIAKLDFEVENFENAYRAALNFIHDEVDMSTLKNELIEYANRVGISSSLDDIPVNKIGIEGQIAYCLNRGAKLKPSSEQRIRTFLSKIKIESTRDIIWEILPYNSNTKNILAYVGCYSHIDNAKARVLHNKLSIQDLSVTVRKIVVDRSNKKEMVVKQLLEHYKDMLLDAKQNINVTDWVKPLTVIVDTLGMLVNNRSSVRSGAKDAKARKLSNTLEQSDRKGEKAASKVTYKDEDNNLGIISVNPTNLIGAEAAVIYNTKNKHCEIYFAETGKRLSMQGAKIINFDSKKSTGKTIRQPETNLLHWNRATTIRRLEVLLDQIKGKNWELTGKFNRNTMILKVL